MFRYFQALADGTISTGPIRVTFQMNGYPHIAYRDRENVPCFSVRANEINFVREFGKLVQITEDEALLLDPDLFTYLWKDYREFTEWEAAHGHERQQSKGAGSL